MNKKGIVTIHNKEYMTVARRVELWLEDVKKSPDAYSIETEIIMHDPVVIKATIKWNNKTFTGVSSVDLQSSKMIEKSNPYEVAETSAVGRALGFAGYGLIDSVASADEVQRATLRKTHTDEDGITHEPVMNGTTVSPAETLATCEVCGAAADEKMGKSKTGKGWHGIFCSTKDRSHTRWLWT